MTASTANARNSVGVTSVRSKARCAGIACAPAMVRAAITGADPASTAKPMRLDGRRTIRHRSETSAESSLTVARMFVLTQQRAVARGAVVSGELRRGRRRHDLASSEDYGFVARLYGQR